MPGFILLGIVPLLAANGIWRRRRWAWRWSFAVALVIWIAAQTRVVGYHTEPPLQAIYGVAGIAIAALAFIGARVTATPSIGRPPQQ